MGYVVLSLDKGSLIDKFDICRVDIYAARARLTQIETKWVCSTRSLGRAIYRQEW